MASAPRMPRRSFRLLGVLPSGVRIFSLPSASRRPLWVFQSVAIASASRSAMLLHACSRLSGSSSRAVTTSYTSRTTTSLARASFPSMICAVLNTVSGLPFTMAVRCSPSRFGRIFVTSSVPSCVLITARCMLDCGLSTPLIALASPPVGGYRFCYRPVRVGGRQVDVVAIAVLPSCAQYGSAADFIASSSFRPVGRRVELRTGGVSFSLSASPCGRFVASLFPSRRALISCLHQLFIAVPRRTG